MTIYSQRAMCLSFIIQLLKNFEFCKYTRECGIFVGCHRNKVGELLTTKSKLVSMHTCFHSVAAREFIGKWTDFFYVSLNWFWFTQIRYFWHWLSVIFNVSFCLGHLEQKFNYFFFQQIKASKFNFHLKNRAWINLNY